MFLKFLNFISPKPDRKRELDTALVINQAMHEQTESLCGDVMHSLEHSRAVSKEFESAAKKKIVNQRERSSQMLPRVEMPGQKGQVQILLVEDNSYVANGIKEQILSTKLNAIITFATSLKEVFELLQKQQFDVILLDLKLPDSTDRGETLKQMTDRVSRTPIVVLTADESPELQIKALEVGVQSYLCKYKLPTNTLFLAISQALEQKKRNESVA